MRLSHLSAVAVMIALVGAMFVAMGSVSAQVVNYCQESGTVLQGASQSCTIDTRHETTGIEATVALDVGASTGVVTDASVAVEASGNVVLVAAEAGSTTVVVTEVDSRNPNSVQNFTPTTTKTKYPITVVETLAIDLGDSDNVLRAPSEVDVSLVVLNKAAATFVDYVRVSGTLRIRGGEPTSNNKGLVALSSYATNKARVIVPAGTPAGDYVVSVQLSNRPDLTDDIPAGSAGFRRVVELPITVGDPGIGLAEVTLSLGVKDDKGTADPTDDDAETGTAVARGGSINLVAEAFNSISAKANGNEVSTISVIANGGLIDVELGLDENADPSEPEAVANTVALTDSGYAASINQKVNLKISKANGRPGTVDVYVFMTGSGGAATSNTLELAFTGPAATLTLGEARGIGAPGMTEFTISGSDSGGSGAALGALAYKVTDAEGNPVSRSLVDPVLGKVGDSTPDVASDNNSRVEAVILDVKTGTKPGVYTVEVSLVGVAKSEATTTFTVAGKVDAVALEASATESDTIGDVITVTASVSDGAGNVIADDTPVTFSVSEGTGLAPIGTGHKEEAPHKTKDGEASVKYAVVGPGTSVVSAEAGGATGVVVIVSTAGMGEPEAMPEEEAGLSCLSSLSGFSTWTCDVEASASEIFDWISSRGATALHLNSNRMWVRYSVVDGAMVPGSSDFMVTKSDILYISN